MNDFQAKDLHKAAHYLQDKINLFKKGGALDTKENVYVVEEKKDSMLKRLVGSMFK